MKKPLKSVRVCAEAKLHMPKTMSPNEKAEQKLLSMFLTVCRLAALDLPPEQKDYDELEKVLAGHHFGGQAGWSEITHLKKAAQKYSAMFSTETNKLA